jgi:hypothetical protein
MTDVPVNFLGRNAPEHAARNPCDGCPAPCCKLLLLPVAAPQTFMELDYLAYAVMLGDVELIIGEDGSWKIGKWGRCVHLTDTERCGVHGTDAKPKTCVFFNPYQCWYKRNFVGKPADAPDVIRLDRAAFDRLLELVVIDDDGTVGYVPSWNDLRKLVST